MSSEVFIWKAVAVVCFLVIVFLFRCLFDANSVLNWYIKEYHSTPRINSTPKRKKYHEALLRFFACTIVQPRSYLKKIEA